MIDDPIPDCPDCERIRAELHTTREKLARMKPREAEIRDALAKLELQRRTIEALKRQVADREEAAEFFAATATYDESEVGERFPWLTWD